MIWFIATIISLVIEGGFSSAQRTRTPIEPASFHNEQGIGFGLGPG